jgi:hypothetical protein
MPGLNLSDGRTYEGLRLVHAVRVRTFDERVESGIQLSLVRRMEFSTHALGALNVRFDRFDCLARKRC